MRLLTCSDAEARAALLAASGRPENEDDHETSFALRMLFQDHATALMKNIRGAEEDVVYGIREAVRAGVSLPSPVHETVAEHVRDIRHGYVLCAGTGRLVDRASRANDRGKQSSGSECRECGEVVDTFHGRLLEHHVIFQERRPPRPLVAEVVTVFAPRHYSNLAKQSPCRYCGHARAFHRRVTFEERHQRMNGRWCCTQDMACNCTKWKRAASKRR